MRCTILRSKEPSQAEWEAERRRNRFHLIEGEGGKPTE
jgi:hypothetical protein